MRARGIGERLLTGGGIIPNDDMAALAGLGVGRLFGPGTNTQDIVAYIREWYAGVHGAAALPPLPPPPSRPEPMVGAGERPTPKPAGARRAVAVRKVAASKPAKKRASANGARAAKAVAKPVAKKSAKKPAKRSTRSVGRKRG